jgi:16S rRNA (guanine527-N7)-methyltransferase
MAMKKEEIFKEIEKFWPLNGDIKQKLDNFVDLLLQHNQKYNLIGGSTTDDIWNRHILDSAQLIKFIPDTEIAVGDFGSGAGLPAIILSILGISEIHLIEKSYRKCEFLEIAKKISNNKIIIHQKLAQDINNLKFDVITSRAFAPLPKLLEITQPFLKQTSRAILPKGKNLQNELDIIKDQKKFDFKIYSSLTSKEGNILVINKF